MNGSLCEQMTDQNDPSQRVCKTMTDFETAADEEMKAGAFFDRRGQAGRSDRVYESVQLCGAAAVVD